VILIDLKSFKAISSSFRLVFLSKYITLSSIILNSDGCDRQGGHRTIIGEMAVKVDAFNALFDEKRAAYVAADRPLDGIFTVC